MSEWDTLADSLDAAAKWLENPEFPTKTAGLLENVIGFAQMYVSTQNPLYAWRAFLFLDSPRKMPEWVLLFLQDQGCAITNAVHDKSITPEKALDGLPNRMGLKGRGNAYSKYRNDKWQARITVELDGLEEFGLKPKPAREHISGIIAKSANTPGNYQKKTHRNWEAQQAAIDKSKSSKKQG